MRHTNHHYNENSRGHQTHVETLVRDRVPNHRFQVVLRHGVKNPPEDPEVLHTVVFRCSPPGKAITPTTSVTIITMPTRPGRRLPHLGGSIGKLSAGRAVAIRLGTRTCC